MYIDLVEALLGSLGEEFIKMVERAVHSAVRAEAHEVQSLAGSLHIVIDCRNLLVLQKLVGSAGAVDLHQVLIDDAAAADIEVTHLRVAHLAVGQTHVFAAGHKVRKRIFGAQGVDMRLTLGVDGVAMVVRALSPSVKNHQQYFFVHILSYICYQLYRLQIY